MKKDEEEKRRREERERQRRAQIEKMSKNIVKEKDTIQYQEKLQKLQEATCSYEKSDKWKDWRKKKARKVSYSNSKATK